MISEDVSFRFNFYVNLIIEDVTIQSRMTFALLRGYVEDQSDVFLSTLECRFTYTSSSIILIRRRRDCTTLRTRFVIIGEGRGRILKLMFTRITRHVCKGFFYSDVLL